MPIVSIAELKSYFENGKVPNEAVYIDMIDTLSSVGGAVEITSLQVGTFPNAVKITSLDATYRMWSESVSASFAPFWLKNTGEIQVRTLNIANGLSEKTTIDTSSVGDTVLSNTGTWFDFSAGNIFMGTGKLIEMGTSRGSWPNLRLYQYITGSDTIAELSSFETSSQGRNPFVKLEAKNDQNGTYPRTATVKVWAYDAEDSDPASITPRFEFHGTYDGGVNTKVEFNRTWNYFTKHIRTDQDLVAYGVRKTRNNSSEVVGGIYVPLTTPLGSTAYSGGGHSTQSKTLLDVSSDFGLADTSDILGYNVSVYIADSGSSGTDCFLILGKDNVSVRGAPLSCLTINGRGNRATLQTNADGNGDFYVQIGASGSGTFTVYMTILGYYR